MSTIRLPRLLSETAGVDMVHRVRGENVREALDDLFVSFPGLGNHILDEKRQVRPHVSVFVDGEQADLHTGVQPGSEIRVLHAVSGG
jgi:sulfur-carrier protein